MRMARMDTRQHCGHAGPVGEASAGWHHEPGEGAAGMSRHHCMVPRGNQVGTEVGGSSRQAHDRKGERVAGCSHGPCCGTGRGTSLEEMRQDGRVYVR